LSSSDSNIPINWELRRSPFLTNSCTYSFASPEKLQDFSCQSTTVGTLHATSLQGFGYGDVVHQFKKRSQAARTATNKIPKVPLLANPKQHAFLNPHQLIPNQLGG
jgi:hypothetical protein